MQPSPAHHLAWNNNNTFHNACRRGATLLRASVSRILSPLSLGQVSTVPCLERLDGNSSEVVNGPGSLAPIPG